MKPAPSHLHDQLESRIFSLMFASILTLITASASGCGGSSGTTPTTALTGNTNITVLASSTANARISEFNLYISGITLTSKTGKTAELLTTPVFPEFIHLNGSIEPMGTASIPQDVYTSATVAVGNGQFTCVAIDPSSGKLSLNEFSDGAVAPSHVTVTLPQPITVTGASMGLALNLLVSQSASYSSTCYSLGFPTFSITPNFSITPVTISNSPTSSANGKATSLNGQVSTVDASGTLVNVAGADGPNLNGPSWPVIVNSSTVFQGVSGVPQLTAGIPVEIDAAIQQQGPMLATRISVADSVTTQLNIFTGPADLVFASQPVLNMFAREQQGHLSQSVYYPGASVDFSNARFRISSALANLQSLPFAPTFSAANIVPGQNISITVHVASYLGGNVPADSVTLMPQAINGTVSTVSSIGGFTTYTVVLASYDLFPVAAAQVFQVSQLANPNVVIAYADSNTSKLTTNPIAVGSVVRVYGLVFNDNGTLRMDCAQINDGVAL